MTQPTQITNPAEVAERQARIRAQMVPAAYTRARDVVNSKDIESAIRKQGNPTSAGQSKSTASSAVSLAYPSTLRGIQGETSSHGTRTPACFMFQAVKISKASVSELSSMRQSVGSVGTNPAGILKTVRDSATGALKQLSTNALNSVVGSSATNRLLGTKATQSTQASILLSTSNIDTDTIKNNFNANKMSKVDRANGSITNAISNAASDFVFTGVNALSGVAADYNEQIYSAARQTYSGTETRRKTFQWDFTPSNRADALEIYKIVRCFQSLSLGVVNKTSKMNTDLLDAVADATKNGVALTGDVNSRTAKAIDATADFFKNAQTTTNDVVWFVKMLGEGPSYDVFGPAQIESVTWDKAPDGEYTPNALESLIPMNSRLTVDFIELVPLTRNTF